MALPRAHGLMVAVLQGASCMLDVSLALGQGAATALGQQRRAPTDRCRKATPDCKQTAA